MTQSKKKISKSQEIRYQWIRQRIEAGEIDTGALYVTEVRPERKREQSRVRLNVAGNRVSYNHYGGTVVSPVLHSLAYRKVWKKITDNYNNRL